MIPTRRALWRKLRDVFHLEDPPGRIALSLAVGVFISCTPFWGLQTLLSIVVALIFRLNRAVTITGTWLNLPWAAPFVYAAALRIGTLILPDPEGARRAWLAFVLDQPSHLSWQDVPSLFRELSLAFLVGTTIVGAAAGLATYLIVFGMMSRRRAARAGAESRGHSAA